MTLAIARKLTTVPRWICQKTSLSSSSINTLMGKRWVGSQGILLGCFCPTAIGRRMLTECLRRGHPESLPRPTGLSGGQTVAGGRPAALGGSSEQWLWDLNPLIHRAHFLHREENGPATALGADEAEEPTFFRHLQSEGAETVDIADGVSGVAPRGEVGRAL